MLDASGAEVTSIAKIQSMQDRSGQITASLEIELCRARRYQRPLSLIAFWITRRNAPDADVNMQRYLLVERGLRRIAPDFLRISDFWGKFGRQTFISVFPETPVAGIESVVSRISTNESFHAFIAKEVGQYDLWLGATELDDTIQSVDRFVDVAKENVVWSSANKTWRLL